MIFLGTDHAGYELKEKIRKFLKKNHIAYEDLSFSFNPLDDYPDIAKIVAKKVKQNKNNKGILVCGTGIGMDIAANRFKGVRAAIVYDKFTADAARSHNNANIICLRGRKFPVKKSINLLKIFLSTPFSNAPRHKRRVNNLDK